MKRIPHSILFAALCLVIPLLLLLPGYARFIYPAGSEYSDLTISHYPNLMLLKQSLQRGAIPFWSNTILSGYPFAADPLSGIWYPFTWVLLVFPQPFGYNLVTSLHLLIGGVGVLLVLRKYGAGLPAAILGAVSFECMPKLLGHYTAGHVSLVWAVSLTVWIIYAEMQYRKRSGSFWRYVPGIILGIIALADIRWAPYSGLLFIALRIATCISSISCIACREKIALRDCFSRMVSVFWGMLLNGIIALCISAVLWLPLLQYTNLSTRSSMGLADRMIYSLSVDKLTGLLYPDMFGNWELWIYIGALGLVSVIVILFNKHRPEGSSFWLWTSIISVIWALGLNNPLMELITGLPGFSLLRVPSRSLFIFGLSASLLIGFCSDLVFRRISFSRGLRLLIFAITIFEVLLALAARMIAGDWNMNLLWGSVMWVLIVLVVFIYDRTPRMPLSLAFGLLLCFQLLDLGGLNLIRSRSFAPGNLPGSKQDLVAWLAEQEGIFRVFSPSYSISQLDAAQAGLELADGIDPLHLLSYDRFMAKASGADQTSYSVSIPPFQTGNPDSDNRNAIPSARQLGILNVRYLVSEFPIDAEGFDFIRKIDNTYVYQNQFFRPRAWIQSSDALDVMGGNLLDGEIEVFNPSPNNVYLRVSSKGGYLVLSDISYPGWVVRVDDKSADILSIGGLLRGVELPEGTHEVTFFFRPLAVYSGASISFLSLMAGIIFALLQLKQRRFHV